MNPTPPTEAQWQRATLRSPQRWHFPISPQARKRAQAAAGRSIRVRPLDLRDSCGCAVWEVHPDDAKPLTPKRRNWYVTTCMIHQKRGPHEGAQTSNRRYHSSHHKATHRGPTTPPTPPRHQRHRQKTRITHDHHARPPPEPPPPAQSTARQRLDDRRIARSHSATVSTLWKPTTRDTAKGEQRMSEQGRIAGTPSRTQEQIERRARISAAVVALHAAIAPLLEVLDSRASITMHFKVAGDDVAVSVKPGKPNDA